MKILVKIFGIDFVCYIFGLRIKFKPMYGNAGISKTTYIIASCHPLNSITWHWALYWSKPVKLLNWWKTLGFNFCKQELVKG